MIRMCVSCTVAIAAHLAGIVAALAAHIDVFVLYPINPVLISFFVLRRKYLLKYCKVRLKRCKRGGNPPDLARTTSIYIACRYSGEPTVSVPCCTCQLEDHGLKVSQQSWQSIFRRTHADREWYTVQPWFY